MASIWQPLLRQRIAPAMAWRVLLGDHFDGLSQFLMASGALADFVPCPRTAATHCGYQVRPGDDDDEFVGFCPEGECPRIELSRSAIALLEVDWLAIAERLGEALGLTGPPSISAPGFGQLGWVAPSVPARTPVFFAFGDEAVVFAAAQRFAEQSPGRPFALIVSSADVLGIECLALLHRRGAEVLELDQTVELPASGELAAPTAAKRLAEFASANAKSAAPLGHEPLDTPDGASWEDVTIREIDGHTIEIHCQVRHGPTTREARGSYSCDSLGWARRSSRGIVPNTDWQRFLLPVVRGKRVVAANVDAWARLRQSKRAVAKLLGELTGLPANGAFRSPRGRFCYEAVFKVECDQGAEVPIPAAPRRLNRKGNVARDAADE